MESEAAVSNETELDVIHSFEIKTYLTERVKQFQAGCIKNHFSEWPSYTMDKEVLGSVSGLSLELFDNKLPHYHKEMEISFHLKKNCFWHTKLKVCFKKVS